MGSETLGNSVFGKGPEQIEPRREHVWALLTDGGVVKAQSLKGVGLLSDGKGVPSEHWSVWFREGSGESRLCRSSG